MTNSNRSPKELKDLIEKCKSPSDVQQFNDVLDETMIKLRNISSEEKTEIGMMKSRIDEQSRIIMMLKQRCDDYIHKNMAMENLNQELIDQKEKIELEYDDLKFKYKQILQRFETLSNYNEEIINIKDDYKHKNVELKEKINKLNQELNNLNQNEKISRLEDEIKFLNNMCQENDSKFILLKQDNETKMNIIKIESNNQILEKMNQIKGLQESLTENEIKLKDINDLFNNKKIEYETKIKQLLDQNKNLNKDKNELKLQMKKINDELNSQLKISNDEKKILVEKCSELEKIIKSLNDKIKNDSILFNENTVIKKLQAEVEDSHKRLEDLQKEFKDFKVYSNNLIEKEKELNAKLRYLVS